MADVDVLEDGALAVLAQAAKAGNVNAAHRLLLATQARRKRDAEEAREAVLLGDDPMAIAREAGRGAMSMQDLQALLGRQPTEREAREFARYRVATRR